MNDHEGRTWRDEARQNLSLIADIRMQYPATNTEDDMTPGVMCGIVQFSNPDTGFKMNWCMLVEDRFAQHAPAMSGKP